jgi:hypothetical protein
MCVPHVSRVEHVVFLFWMNFTLLVYLFIYYLKWYFFRFHISIIYYSKYKCKLIIIINIKIDMCL